MHNAYRGINYMYDEIVHHKRVIHDLLMVLSWFACEGATHENVINYREILKKHCLRAYEYESGDAANFGKYKKNNADN